MRVAILGNDGYTGWPLTCHLLNEGYDVIGYDNLMRRRLAGDSIIPINTPSRRESIANSVYPGDYQSVKAGLKHPKHTKEAVEESDVVVNLAQIPSAPYSMLDPSTGWQVQNNNNRIAYNLLHAAKGEDTPIVQLATMGEYGTPDDTIPEGFTDAGRPAPKEPGSFYHVSKVQMTANAQFAARAWDLPITEIYQGIVFGSSIPAFDGTNLGTRFDADPMFGTVLNRFIAQSAIGEDLTVYGKGFQKRALLTLTDCVRAIQRIIENPPSKEGPGHYPYRAINQFYTSSRINRLAMMVSELTRAGIEHIDNPRVEDDDRHYYVPEREVLEKLGFGFKGNIESEVSKTYQQVQNCSNRINEADLKPTVQWG